jgi:hypothetical protein
VRLAYIRATVINQGARGHIFGTLDVVAAIARFRLLGCARAGASRTSVWVRYLPDFLNNIAVLYTPLPPLDQSLRSRFLVRKGTRPIRMLTLQDGRATISRTSWQSMWVLCGQSAPLCVVFHCTRICRNVISSVFLLNLLLCSAIEIRADNPSLS